MTWATSMPILVLLGLSVLDLGTMYVTDRRQTERQTDRRNICASVYVSVRRSHAAVVFK